MTSLFGDSPMFSGVSSTQGGRLLAEEKDMSALVPASVRNYIMAERLYQE